MSSRPNASRRGSPLVERHSELEAIEDALAAAIAGEGRLLILEGPAGIGKTSLLGAARIRAAETGVVVLRARGDHLEVGFPYGLVRQLFERVVRSADDDRRAALLAGSAGPAAAAILDRPVRIPDPTDIALSVAHGLYWLVTNLSAESPLVLLLDDAHLSDTASLRFAAYLARRLDRLSASVIVTIRTGSYESSDPLVTELRATPSARVVTVAPLSDTGVAELLGSAFDQTPDPAFVHACRVATQGNPYFLAELSALLRADGVNPSEAAAEQVPTASPETIARTVTARLAETSTQASELAISIAVLGNDATLPRAAALAELDETKALTALDALVTADIVEDGEVLSLRHPIVAAAIYDALAPGVRSAMHYRAAELLTAAGADVDSVAAHLMQTHPTGDLTTVDALRTAGAHALALGAADAAVTYLARALAEEPPSSVRAEVLLELATAEQTAFHPAALEHFVEARRLSGDPMVRARSALAVAEIAWYGAGNFDRFLVMMDVVRAELGDREEGLLHRAETLAAAMTSYDPRLVHFFDGRRPELEELVSRRRPGTRPLALTLAANAAQRDEPADRVLALFDIGWDDGRYLTDGEPILLLPQGIGALSARDELDRAEEVTAAWSLAARKRGSVMDWILVTAHEGMSSCLRGDLTAATAQLRSALERALELGVQLAVASLPWYCNEVLFERTDVADIAALVESLPLGPLADVQIGALLTATRGRLRFDAGRRAEGIADLRRAGETFEALSFTNSFGAQSWRSSLALMIARESPEEARGLAEAELADAERAHHARRIGIALRTRGVLADDPTAALDALTASRDVLATTPARLEYARTLVDLGATLRRQGERKTARSMLRDGLDLAADCGALVLTDRARAELATAGAQPRRDRTTGRDALTPMERRVAELAAEGRSSPDIAQSLFISSKTVENHLARVYTKLDINSRRQLGEALRP